MIFNESFHLKANLEIFCLDLKVQNIINLMFNARQI